MASNTQSNLLWKWKDFLFFPLFIFFGGLGWYLCPDFLLFVGVPFEPVQPAIFFNKLVAPASSEVALAFLKAVF